MDRDAYNNGMQAFRSRPHKYKNPYAQGSSAHNDFERGWVQAQKRAPASMSNPRDKPVLPESTTAPGKKLTVAEQKAVEAYRKRKG
jgi:hypothetical protein